MKNEDLTKTVESLNKKLDKENQGKIADDIGIIITDNANMNKELAAKDEEIKKLKETNEKLIISNGNLLQQVSNGVDPTYQKEQQQKREIEEEEKHFNLADSFDSYGNFKR